MVRPLATGKKTVNLAPSGPKVSRIRRDPPPPKLKELSLDERNERDRRNAVIGIIAFTLALIVILFAVSSWAGWTPAQYTLQM